MAFLPLRLLYRLLALLLASGNVPNQVVEGLTGFCFDLFFVWWWFKYAIIVKKIRENVNVNNGMMKVMEIKSNMADIHTTITHQHVYGFGTHTLATLQHRFDAAERKGKRGEGKWVQYQLGAFF